MILQAACYLAFWLLKYKTASELKLRSNNSESNWKTTSANMWNVVIWHLLHISMKIKWGSSESKKQYIELLQSSSSILPYIPFTTQYLFECHLVPPISNTRGCKQSCTEPELYPPSSFLTSPRKFLSYNLVFREWKFPFVRHFFSGPQRPKVNWPWIGCLSTTIWLILMAWQINVCVCNMP